MGQTFTNARPMIDDSGMGPKTLLSLEFPRFHPSSSSGRAGR